MGDKLHLIATLEPDVLFKCSKVLLAKVLEYTFETQQLLMVIVHLKFTILCLSFQVWAMIQSHQVCKWLG